MAKTTDIYVTQSVNVGLASFVNADGTAQKTLFTAGTNGSSVYAITIASTDTAARNMLFSILRSAVNYDVGAVPVAIAAGTNGTTAGADGLGSIIPGHRVDNNGKRFMLLKGGDVLQAKMLVAVTAATKIDVIVWGEDYD